MDEPVAPDAAEDGFVEDPFLQAQLALSAVENAVAHFLAVAPALSRDPGRLVRPCVLDCCFVRIEIPVCLC